MNQPIVTVHSLGLCTLVDGVVELAPGLRIQVDSINAVGSIPLLGLSARFDSTRQAFVADVESIMLAPGASVPMAPAAPTADSPASSAAASTQVLAAPAPAPATTGFPFARGASTPAAPAAAPAPAPAKSGFPFARSASAAGTPPPAPAAAPAPAPAPAKSGFPFARGASAPAAPAAAPAAKPPSRTPFGALITGGRTEQAAQPAGARPGATKRPAFAHDDDGHDDIPF